jgi:hypothetical protein
MNHNNMGGSIMLITMAFTIDEIILGTMTC